MPEVKGESFNADPEGNHRGEGVGDDRFPALKDDHPVVVVVWPVVEYQLEILLILKTELETVMAQVRACNCTPSVPLSRQSWNERPNALLLRVCNPTDERKGVLLDKGGVV